MSDERETIQRNPESVAAWKRECAFLREQVEKLTDECVVLRASSRYKLETISSLELQVEKLTKERDAMKTVPMKYRRMQFNAELQDEVTQLQKQLAALAKQNEKMREALEMIVVSSLTHPRVSAYADKTLSLPDLATPVLNRIRAEGMRMAAEILIDPMDRAAAQKICAQADELEKQNG